MSHSNSGAPGGGCGCGEKKGNIDWKGKGFTSTYLHFNIQDTYSALLSNVLHGLDASAVVVSAELRMLDEPIAVHKAKEIFLGREEVFPAVFFAGSWGAGGV